LLGMLKNQVGGGRQDEVQQGS